MKKLVSIIIVNWNGKQYLEKCLNSLYAQTYKNFEVIFVDNGSSDDSIDFIKKNYPKVKIIKNKENLGFAQANNIGYNNSKGDYILFLNNDVEATENFLIELVKVLQSSEKIGGAQSKILLMDKPDIIDSAGAYFTNTGFLYYYGTFKKNSAIYNKENFIYSAKGASMIFKRDILEAIKVRGEILDSRYFAYFEETDMCHRVWLAGFKIVFVPKSVIYHKMGGTSVRLNNSFVQFNSFKNRINSYIKNLGIINAIKIVPIHLLVCEIYALISLLQFKLFLFVAIQKAILWNISNLQKTLELRDIVQNKIRKVDDSEFSREIFKYPKLSYFYRINNLDKFTDKDFLGA